LIEKDEEGKNLLKHSHQCKSIQRLYGVKDVKGKK